MQTSSPPPMDVHALSRFLRILFFVMVLSVILYGVVIVEVAPQIQSRSPGSMKTALSVLAAVVGLAVLYLRFGRVGALLSPDYMTYSTPSLISACIRQFLDKMPPSSIVSARSAEPTLLIGECSPTEPALVPISF